MVTSKVDLEKERQRRALEAWTKPLSMPKPAPKSVPKKRGRPKKEESDGE